MNIGTVYLEYCAHIWYLCSHIVFGWYLSEDDPSPRFNGAVLTIATLIKLVMASAAEAELAALFVAAHKVVPHCQTLIDMG
jgi:hypothetical protein